jgi:hypothetical protein
MARVGPGRLSRSDSERFGKRTFPVLVAPRMACIKLAAAGPGAGVKEAMSWK